MDPTGKWLDRIILLFMGYHFVVMCFATALGHFLCFIASFIKRRKRRLMQEASPKSVASKGKLPKEEMPVPCMHNRRILFSGCAGLQFYQSGVMTAILEKYGDRLRHDVSFEGISGGSFTAAFTLAALRGIRSIPFWIKHCGMAIYQNASDRMFGMFWTTSGEVGAAADRWYNECQRVSGKELPEHCQDGSMIAWVTDVRTLSAVPISDFSNPTALREAVVASSFIPIILHPHVWSRLDYHSDIDIGLDGGMAPFLGDNYPFSNQSFAGDAKTLWIECWPSIPAPPNVIKLELWRWDDYRWSDAVLWGDTDRAERLYLRAYQTAKERMSEIDVVMEELLS